MKAHFVITIMDDFESMGPLFDDYVGISYNNAPMAVNVAVGNITWVLGDATATALSSDELTTSRPDLADWTAQMLTIERHSISQPSQLFSFWGEVSEISKVQ